MLTRSSRTCRILTRTVSTKLLADQDAVVGPRELVAGTRSVPTPWIVTPPFVPWTRPRPRAWKRYVMVSYIGAGQDHVFLRTTLSTHTRSPKADADDHLRASSLKWTILGQARSLMTRPVA